MFFWHKFVSIKNRDEDEAVFKRFGVLIPFVANKSPQIYTLQGWIASWER